jgi:hypothetical protein
VKGKIVVSARLFRGAALVAALVPLALAVLPAPVWGQAWSPSVTWSSYLGGGQVDELRDAVTNASDEVLVVGQTDSTSGFPADAGLPGSDSGRDAVVARLNQDGSLAWARVFGGSGNDLARRVRWVDDGTGDVFVTGTLSRVTGSTGIRTSPTTLVEPAASQSYQGGSSDAFLARVSANGELRWFIFVGGDDTDEGVSLAVDERTVYVGGRSRSSSSSFSGLVKDSARGDGFDAFVTQVDLTNADSPKVVWTRFIGTADTNDVPPFADDTTYTLLVKDSKLYMAGTVGSRFSESGITPVEDFHGGTSDGFVAKLSRTGSVDWFTHVGNDATDDVRDLLAVPGVAGVTVVGRTNSLAFPSTGSGEADIDTYVLQLQEDGVRVTGGLRVGSGDDEEVAQAAVDALGNVFVGGRTTSSSGLDQNAFDATYSGNSEGFVAMVDAALTRTIWSSYVGGNSTSAEEWVRAMVAGPRGRLTLVGSSDAPDVLQGPLRHDPSHNGNLDGILFRLEVDPSAPSTGQVEALLSETGISATWGFADPSRNFTDPETGISRYEWAIGHSGQSDNVQPFTSVKTSTEGSASFQPQAGLTYSVTVRAFNGVGRPSNEARSTELPYTRHLLGWGCASTGGGGLAGVLGLVALASLMAHRARRAPDAER